MKEKIRNFWKNRKNHKKTANWLFYYAKPYVPHIVGIMVLGLLTTGITLLMTLITKDIIDKATSSNMESLGFFILLYVALVIVMQVLLVVNTLVSTMVEEKFSFRIRKQIYEKILTSHWMDVSAYHTGDLMTRLTSDAGNVANGIINTIPNIFKLMLELIMVFCTLFYFSPILACFALLIAPVAAIMSLWLGTKLKKLQVKVQESESAYRSFLQESLANLLIIKSFSNEEHASENLVELREKRFYWVLKRTKFGLISSTTMSTTFQLGYIVAFAYGAFMVAEQSITYGVMSVFLSLVNRVQAPIIQLADQIPKVVSILASADRVMELQDIPLEEKQKEHLASKEIGIKMEHLSFGYHDDKIIKDSTMQINPGEFIAILGESGIGKTTLIRLIMSFMSKKEGNIEFFTKQGESELANAGTRDYIAYVPQGNTLFSGTIRKNILMGKYDASDEEIVEALKMASAYEFVMKLENGIDTLIGEHGFGLSEGQAQRIAIARAFIKKAPILILDEATSALDENTELLVLKGLQELRPKPTCLIITHRKSILQYCDRELKIINGNLVEE